MARIALACTTLISLDKYYTFHAGNGGDAFMKVDRNDRDQTSELNSYMVVGSKPRRGSERFRSSQPLLRRLHPFCFDLPLL